MENNFRDDTLRYRKKLSYRRKLQQRKEGLSLEKGIKERDLGRELQKKSIKEVSWRRKKEHKGRAEVGGAGHMRSTRRENYDCGDHATKEEKMD